MTFTPCIAGWSVLVLFVLVLALYRKLIMLRHENDLMHLCYDGNCVIPQQIALSKKIEAIDHWGEMLTIIVLGSGLLLAGAWLYQAWGRSQMVG